MSLPIELEPGPAGFLGGSVRGVQVLGNLSETDFADLLESVSSLSASAAAKPVAGEISSEVLSEVHASSLLAAAVSVRQVETHFGIGPDEAARFVLRDMPDTENPEVSLDRLRQLAQTELVRVREKLIHKVHEATSDISNLSTFTDLRAIFAPDGGTSDDDVIGMSIVTTLSCEVLQPNERVSSALTLHLSEQDVRRLRDVLDRDLEKRAALRAAVAGTDWVDLTIQETSPNV